MTITIVDYNVRDYSHDKYDVVFHSETIHTLVTHTPSMVDAWLSNLPRNSHTSNSLVGLDVEWLPNRQRNMDNPIAIIQLCINRECLVFQILRASFIPQSLVAFLENQGNTFVGVGIEQDVEKLLRDYSLRVANFLELRTLATQRLGEYVRGAGLKTLAAYVLEDVEKLLKDYSLCITNFLELRTLATERFGEHMRGTGLKTLAAHVLGKDIEKPRRITMSRWDNFKLTPQQVQYACIDAFASFEIGRILYDSRV
ncbi:werner syndrome-like exonuclease-like protein [Trifolium pratense]|uniref:Werner syndrome-like exonuclease-like protein n=1 Tax=Trifolium pratense TaxID=57577 RepID=A0A2K3N902_TRIPR|nr:werner syndrome-like exonuclease-like protein [Trifolium pratense]